MGTRDKAQEEKSKASISSGVTRSGTLRQEPLRGRPVTTGKGSDRKIKGKARDGEAGRGPVALGVRPWQPPANSSLQGQEGSLNCHRRGSSAPSGLTGSPCPHPYPRPPASSTKNWRPGLHSLGWSSQRQTLPVCSVPCQRGLLPNSQGRQERGPRTSTFWSSPSLDLTTPRTSQRTLCKDLFG